MTVLTTHAGTLDARAVSRAAGYRVEIIRDCAQALARWKAFDASTPFQHPQWYQAWYSAFAGHAGPLIAIVSDAATGGAGGIVAADPPPPGAASGSSNSPISI